MLKLNSRTQEHVGRAAIEFERLNMPRSLWKWDTNYPHEHRSAGGRSPIGARGEATSSEFQLMTYPCYVGISKHSPPTIYHGQGLA